MNSIFLPAVYLLILIDTNSPSVLVLHLQVVDHLVSKHVLGIAAVSPFEFEALGSGGGALQPGRDGGQLPGASKQRRAQGTSADLIYCLNLHTDTETQHDYNTLLTSYILVFFVEKQILFLV